MSLLQLPSVPCHLSVRVVFSPENHGVARLDGKLLVCAAEVATRELSLISELIDNLSCSRRLVAPLQTYLLNGSLLELAYRGLLRLASL